MGMVKNRCKNGDRYWVDVYVTPVLEHGTIRGYESVRVKASRDVIDRAERTYARLNEGLSAVPVWQRWWEEVQAYVLVVSCVFLVLLGGLYVLEKNSILHVALAFALSSFIATGSVKITKSKLNKVLQASRRVINDPLAAFIYTGRGDSAGEIMLAQLAQQARIRTTLGRFDESAKEWVDKSVQARE